MEGYGKVKIFGIFKVTKYVPNKSVMPTCNSNRKAYEIGTISQEECNFTLNFRDTYNCGN